MKKKLLILTGPQGSGNHLMAKLFSLHPEVAGWKELLEKYWIGHDQERFSPYWAGHRELEQSLFNEAQYWVTSVSVPFIDNGVEKVPDIEKFAAKALSFGLDVTLGIIVRDHNIVRLQQKRVRGKETIETALQIYHSFLDRKICPVHFLDFQSACLYKTSWLHWMGQTLNFPVSSEKEKIDEILSDNANKKYVDAVSAYWLDEEVKKASKAKG